MSEKRETRGVYEHPPGSGVWRIDYYDADGRRHREKIGKKSLAIDVYHQRKAAISEGRFVAKRRAPAVLFRQIADERMSQLKPHLAFNSYYADSLKVPRLVEWFGNRPASSITHEMIREKTDELAGAGLAGGSVNRWIALLSSIYSHAVRNGRISENPVKRVRRHREPIGRIRFLDSGEELALREAIREIDPDFEYELDVFLNTGLRRQEYFSLTWSAVDLDNGILSIVGKGQKLRRVPINSSARAALLKLHALSKGSPYVSRSKAARRPLFLDGRTILRRALTQAGVENFHTYHDLRHTFASRLAMAGVDVVTIRDYLGHASLETTQIYMHLSPAHKREGIERLVAPKAPAAVDTPTDTPAIARKAASGK